MKTTVTASFCMSGTRRGRSIHRGRSNITKSVKKLTIPPTKKAVLKSQQLPGTIRSQDFSIGRHIKRKVKAPNKLYPHMIDIKMYVMILKVFSDGNLR